MTTERAIELLNRISDSQFDGIHGDERREALSMAVRALKQNLVKESGGLVQDLVKDCISRQQAIDAVAKWFHDDVFGITESDGTATIFKRLRDLPSARTERKKGKWIEHNPHKWGLGIIYECSECGYEMDCEDPNYCPSCGADMRGESDE